MPSRSGAQRARLSSRSSGVTRVVLTLIPDTERVMDYCSSLLARRAGGSKRDVLRRWKADVGAALAIRRARMAQRCLPRADARTDFILHGTVEDGRAGWRAAGGHLGVYAGGEDNEVEVESGEEEDDLGDLLESDADEP